MFILENLSFYIPYFLDYKSLTNIIIKVAVFWATHSKESELFSLSH